MNVLVLHIGAIILFIWGIAHIAPTRSVVAGFGPLTVDNRIIIAMEWVAEGRALASIGLLVALATAATGPSDLVARLVVGTVIGFCLVIGGWTFAIGRRSSILPIRLCPLVLAVAAALLVLGLIL